MAAAFKDSVRGGTTITNQMVMTTTQVGQSAPGLFPQDFAKMTDSIKKSLGSATFASDIFVTQLQLARSSSFQTMLAAGYGGGVPGTVYQVWLAYVDGAGGNYSQSIGLFPFTTYNLGYIPRIIGNYTVNVNLVGNNTLYMIPTSVATQGQVATQITIYVNTCLSLPNLNGGPQVTTEVLWTGWAIYPNIPYILATTDPIPITLPDWINNNFWATQLFAFGANDDYYGEQYFQRAAANGDTTYAPYPTQNVNLASALLSPTYLSFSLPIPIKGQPSTTVQFSLDCLPISQYGNQTQGQPLIVSIVVPSEGNQQSFELNPLFAKSTIQKITNAAAIGRSNLFAQDKNSRIFYSFTAAFDITLLLQLSSRATS